MIGPSRRLVSLDVFRGATIAAMILVNNPGDWDHVYAPLEHARWNGWTPTDLIFPFFLFITGVASALSSSAAARPPRRAFYAKLVRRCAILFALGLFLNGFPSFHWGTIRIMGVLQRIALCSLAASVVQWELGEIGAAVAAAALLFVYWALMALVPVPGLGAGLLEPGRSFAAYVDGLVLSGHMWGATKTWDPEGLISTLPAIATTLFGVLTGRWLVGARSAERKAVGMLLAGLAAVAVGQAWSFALPINKNIWTSSYAVFTAGLALVALSAGYYLIEVQGRKGWAKPFEIFGRNAIAAYVISEMAALILPLLSLNFRGRAWTVDDLYRGLFASWLSPLHASLAFAAVFAAATYACAWGLYKKGIFLKIG